MADWSLLPYPLVDYVAGFLSAAGQARMAAACKPWRAAMADGLSRRKHVPSIWLVFPPGTKEERHEACCEFESFSEAMAPRYIFRRPAAEETIVIGCSNGWLLMEGKFSRMQAFNPLTKAKVVFPPLDDFFSIGKAVVVPPKAGLGRSNSPVLVAILRTRGQRWDWLELAFAAAGDDVWTDLAKASTSVRAKSYFHDILAHNGKLYALDKSYHVLVFDLRGEKPSSSSSSPSWPTVTLIKVEPHSNPRSANGLAVISGELNLVQWSTDEFCPFEVFRLRAGPQKRLRWVKTRELAGHAILHSSNGVLALPVGEYRELTADCIFTVEADVTDYRSARLTVMNMAGRAIRTEQISTPSFCTPFWFLANSGS